MRKILNSMGYMFIITLFFTSLVSAVRLSNEDRIERNRQVKLQKTILRVLGISPHGKSDAEDIFRVFNRRIETIRVRDRNFYIGYDEDGRSIKGYAFPVGGPGFWGPIQGMVAVDPKASKILGIAFYKHSETPGLGGRISEKWFADQFKGLPLHPMEGGKMIFYLTPRGTGKASNELDAITGATGTSHAVEAFLNNELDMFLKNFWKSLKTG